MHTAATDGKHHALCYLDLDQFKAVNDSCGHAAGDELLRQLADLLREQIRSRDTLARLGGDEFGLLLEHCTTEQAMRVVDVLRKTVEEFRFSWQEKMFRIGVSVGLVPIDGGIAGVGGILKAADSACYAAKDAGRNRIHVYRRDDEILAQRSGEMSWLSRLQQALDQNHLCLAWQPIRSLGINTHGDHYEVLVRLQDRNGSIILPGAFLPAAERYGLGPRLDRWVVTSTLTYLVNHPDDCKRLRQCSINLSGQSLADETFQAYVLKQLDESGIEAQKICFEVTETAAVAHMSAALRFMQALKNRGCRLALDDFGSGMSSFAYLKNLPIDVVKIDGQFVRDMANDPVDYPMVRSINEIGHLLGKETVAEFVESDAILEKVRALGVDYAQGYAIGRPTVIPANDCLADSARSTGGD